MMDREERREEGERIEEQMELKEDRKVGSRTERKEDGKMEERMALEIDSISRNEEFARVVVAVFMSRMNPTLEEVDDVKTAVSEAVTNAVIHGYGQKKGMIYIEGKIEGNELTVVVKDLGIGIDNLKKPWNPCTLPIQAVRDPAWAFLLWKLLWINWKSNPSREKEPWSE